MPALDSLHCDVEHAPNDQFGNTVTIVKCHGRLINDTSERFKEIIKPLIPRGGRIVLDLADISQLDSSGLGTLVSLKVSAINHGYCMLELTNLTPRILELLRITNLVPILTK
jgi:anti-anti-sigma factor